MQLRPVEFFFFGSHALYKDIPTLSMFRLQTAKMQANRTCCISMRSAHLACFCSLVSLRLVQGDTQKRARVLPAESQT